MSELEAVVVPRDLYYHEVAYVQRLEKLVSQAVKFQFTNPAREDPIYVESRGRTGWAVTEGSRACFNTDGEWEYEPMPSNRDDDFIARTRFTLDEALKIAESVVTIPR